MLQKPIKISLLLAVSMLLTANTWAQSLTVAEKTNEVKPLVYYPNQTRVPVWLDLSAGLSVANCYDNGTIPFSYFGYGMNAGAGATVEWGRFHVRPAFHLFQNATSDPAGSVTDLNFSTEVLYRIHGAYNNRLRLWVGGTLQGMLDIKALPELQNASTCVSLFGNIGATGMVQYDFAFNKAKNHPWLTTYFKLNLPLHGMAMRPSYSYIGNPTINMAISDALFGDKESFGKFFPGADTELGLYLNLLNGNRVGFCYRWDYLSTGKKGTYRYDNALHSFNLNFMFKIN